MESGFRPISGSYRQLGNRLNPSFRMDALYRPDRVLQVRLTHFSLSLALLK